MPSDTKLYALTDEQVEFIETMLQRIGDADIGQRPHHDASHHDHAEYQRKAEEQRVAQFIGEQLHPVHWPAGLFPGAPGELGALIDAQIRAELSLTIHRGDKGLESIRGYGPDGDMWEYHGGKWNPHSFDDSVGGKFGLTSLDAANAMAAVTARLAGGAE